MIPLEETSAAAPNPNSFTNYLKEIGRYKLLTREQEITFGTQVQAMMEYEKVRRKLGIELHHFIRIKGLDPTLINSIYAAGNAAKTKLINHNLRLVVNIVKRYSTLSLSFYDMVQEGNLGLIKGAEKYDPSFNVKFSTYATWWIKESINKGITNGGRAIRLPVHVTDKIRLIREQRRKFHAANDRYPDEAELVAVTGLSLDIIKRVAPHTSRLVSLDCQIESEANLIDYIADPVSNNSYEQLNLSIMQQTAKDLMSILTELEHQILCASLGLFNQPAVTKDVIAARYQITPHKVRSIERVALKKLKEEFTAVPAVTNLVVSHLP